MSFGGDLRLTVGLFALVAATFLTALGNAKQEHAERIEDLSRYWHLVDMLWVMVLIVLYVVGR